MGVLFDESGSCRTSHAFCAVEYFLPATCYLLYFLLATFQSECSQSFNTFSRLEDSVDQIWVINVLVLNDCIDRFEERLKKGMVRFIGKQKAW